MKKILLLSAISLMTGFGFAQTVSNEKKAVIIPVENKEQISLGLVPDSMVVIHASSREIKTEAMPVVIPANETNSGKQEKTAHSSARKPN